MRRQVGKIDWCAGWHACFALQFSMSRVSHDWIWNLFSVCSKALQAASTQVGLQSPGAKYIARFLEANTATRQWGKFAQKASVGGLLKIPDSQQCHVGLTNLRDIHWIILAHIAPC